MSRPSEPDEIASTSIDLSFLPSFITEPLPNWRSIWDSAADSAFDLSMDEPSTIRSAGWAGDDMGRKLLMNGIRRPDNETAALAGDAPRPKLDGNSCTLF